MPLHDVRSAYLPYCLDKQSDGSYAVLNRDYKPLGFLTRSHVNYSDYPVCAKIAGLTAATAQKLSWNASPDLDRIYLYNDGCIPTRSKENMDAYLKRIRILAALKISWD